MTDSADCLTPGDLIKKKLADREWSQIDLGMILDRPQPRINEIIRGKTSITPETAVQLAAAFGDSPEEWLLAEVKHRLSAVDPEVAEGVQRRARLYELAPLNELRKRGWIRSKGNLGDVESDLLKLLGTTSLDEAPAISAAMRMSSPNIGLTPSQVAWCCRVQQLARLVESAPFDESNLGRCENQLRKLAAYPKEARKVAAVLSEFGIKFVVVQHLTGTKVDGAALWLSDSEPVIGMSLRYDRVDGFWFTLFHELSHIRHRDAPSVDSEHSVVDDPSLVVKPEFERRADSDASASLIPSEQLESFVRRIGPLYSKDDIVRFAHTIKLHPGVIVGQLQHRGEVGYGAYRPLLSKVRDAVISEALTDGWGHSIKSEFLQ